MKFKYFYTSYIVFGFLTCLLALFDMLYLSVAFRWLSLFMISAVYFNVNKTNDLLFYLGIIFSGLAESFMTIGVEGFHVEVNICFAIYAWLVVFLLRNSVNHVKVRIKKEQIVPLIISAFLTIYLLFYILDIISPKFKETIVYSYIFVFSFLVMLSYLAILYVSNHSKRYIWLLFLIIAFIVTTLVGSLESLYYQNNILKSGVYAIQIASHYFLLRFLITPDEDISYLD